MVPESLAFCWTLVRDSEDMAGAELELEVVRADVVPDVRSALRDQVGLVDLLSACESSDVEVVRGNEFLVTSLDVT